jgi:hypothetical protein
VSLPTGTFGEVSVVRLDGHGAFNMVGADGTR